MKFENVKEKEMPQDSAANQIGAELASQIEYFAQARMRQLFRAAPEGIDKKDFVRDQIALHGKTFFEGKEELLDDLLEKIDAAHYATDEELREGISNDLAGTLSQLAASPDFSLAEASRRFRIATHEYSGFTPLDENGALSYSRFDDKLDLHITKGLDRRTFQEAVNKLRDILQSDESIRTIELASPVVTEHPDAMRRFGFTIDEKMDEEELREIREYLPEDIRDKPIGKAHMTREEFFAKYGQAQ